MIIKKSLQTCLNLVFVLWSAPQTIRCIEEAITLQSSFLPVAFRGGVFAKCAENRFFLAKNSVQKRHPTAFLVDILLICITKRVFNCFPYIFATDVANT